MRILDFVEFSLAGLRKRKLRTFLTVSGVTIGIGALVSMMAFGKGMQRNITQSFVSSGLFNSITVLPGRAPDPGGDPDVRPSRRPRPPASGPVLDDRAVEAILKIAGVATAFPDISIPVLVALDGREEFRFVQVVPAHVAASDTVRIGWGKPYPLEDGESVIVSQSLLRQFEAGDPAAAVGRKIRITSVAFDFAALGSLDLSSLLSGRSLPLKKESREFTIAGVMEASAFGGPNPFQSDVLASPEASRRIGRLPFSSIWDLFRLKDGLLGYSAVNVRLESLRDLEAVKERVRDMGFATFALADQFEQIKRSWVYLDMILAAVGMIAIVVAALGIVNTMVMSILERYREIGIMKAVGARDGDVRRIFFFESAAIGTLGGLFGFALGWAVSGVINRIINFYLARQGIPSFEYFAFPAWIFLGAVGFAVLVSLVSGLYPANRAARVDPVVALRHD